MSAAAPPTARTLERGEPLSVPVPGGGRYTIVIRDERSRELARFERTAFGQDSEIGVETSGGRELDALPAGERLETQVLDSSGKEIDRQPFMLSEPVWRIKLDDRESDVLELEEADRVRVRSVGLKQPWAYVVVYPTTSAVPTREGPLPDEGWQGPVKDLERGVIFRDLLAGGQQPQLGVYEAVVCPRSDPKAPLPTDKRECKTAVFSVQEPAAPGRATSPQQVDVDFGGPRLTDGTQATVLVDPTAGVTATINPRQRPSGMRGGSEGWVYVTQNRSWSKGDKIDDWVARDWTTLAIHCANQLTASRVDASKLKKGQGHDIIFSKNEIFGDADDLICGADANPCFTVEPLQGSQATADLLAQLSDVTNLYAIEWIHVKFEGSKTQLSLSPGAAARDLGWSDPQAAGIERLATVARRLNAMAKRLKLDIAFHIEARADKVPVSRTIKFEKRYHAEIDRVCGTRKGQVKEDQQLACARGQVAKAELERHGVRLSGEPASSLYRSLEGAPYRAIVLIAKIG